MIQSLSLFHKYDEGRSRLIILSEYDWSQQQQAKHHFTHFTLKSHIYQQKSQREKKTKITKYGYLLFYIGHFSTTKDS